MTRSSLRLRLALAGGLALIVTLIAAQFGLSILFNRHAERAIATDLSDLSDYLVVALDPAADGSLTLTALPPDPAFNRPYSGRYWAVSVGDQSWASRSLWDFTLTLPPAPPPGEGVLLTLPGPQDTALLALDRSVIRPTPAGEKKVRITTALDRARIDAARAAFGADMLPWLAVLGLTILAAGAIQIRVGLAPLATLGQRLQALTSGAQDRIGDSVPQELAPLARQIDHLLDARATEIDRSRRRAADLAHGLKTPLQALLGDAARLRDADRQTEAAGIEAVVRSIRLQVDRELTRATLAGGTPGTTADPARALRGVMAVLQRTPRGAALAWQIDATEGLSARIDSADLTEALGALLENAVAHAQAQITLAARRDGAAIVITLQDDGPGMPPDQIARLRQRGQRLDMADTGDGGTGLGLAIADEIVT
ncbi:MAG: sensor histidine kinase, partial [Rhodobacter sp.]|nr:sensor histidine kinase [Rhodobacter sp.]